MKIIFTALCFLFIIASIASCSSPSPAPRPPNPASDFEYEDNTELGGIVITKYVGSSRTVRIPDEVEGLPVIGIEGAFQNGDVSRVDIPNSVTIIGDDAFRDSTLTNIVLPENVTRIGHRAFSGSRLHSISLPDGMQSISDSALDGISTAVYKGENYSGGVVLGIHAGDLDMLYRIINGG